jgi:chemotaxis protein methyltransferase CheR
MSATAPHGLPGADDYVAFCQGIERLCRIELSSYKRGQMERRIRSFAAGRGKPELLDYLALLAHDDGELDHFLDRMTINVSQLWRNPLQWQTLAESVIPEIAAAGQIRAWSAGCSYGAELFTLAAICSEVAPGVTPSLRGSDIDERMLARARVGRFSDGDVRTVPEASLARWFDRCDGGWQARDELRALVRFENEDLLRCRPEPGSHDLICCRNTVIYFTEDSRAELHHKLAGALRPGGWLLVGCTERINEADRYGLELVHPFTYRKS